jgi:tRNA/rRNA methyltransferase
MAGTDKTRNQVLGPAPVVVLVNPQLGENIGTAARAMANFGLHELRIVAPRDGWPNEKALTASSGANWIIEDAAVFGDLASALKDVNYVYATTARPRGMTKEVLTPG